LARRRWRWIGPFKRRSGHWEIARRCQSFTSAVRLQTGDLILRSPLPSLPRERGREGRGRLEGWITA
jgi:hypothetical protein